MINIHNQEIGYNKVNKENESSVTKGTKNEARRKETRIDMWKNFSENIGKFLTSIKQYVDAPDNHLGWIKKLIEMVGIGSLLSVLLLFLYSRRADFLYKHIYGANVNVKMDITSVPESFGIGMSTLLIAACVVAIVLLKLEKDKDFANQVVETGDKAISVYGNTLLSALTFGKHRKKVYCIAAIVVGCMAVFGSERVAAFWLPIDQLLAGLLDRFTNLIAVVSTYLEYIALICLGVTNGFLCFQHQKADCENRKMVSTGQSVAFVVGVLFFISDFLLSKNICFLRFSTCSLVLVVIRWLDK